MAITVWQVDNVNLTLMQREHIKLLCLLIGMMRLVDGLKPNLDASQVVRGLELGWFCNLGSWGLWGQFFKTSLKSISKLKSRKYNGSRGE